MAANSPTQVHAELRHQLGGNSGRKLRRQGKLPAVLYGHEQRPLHLQLNEDEFRKKFRHISENTLIDLLCDGESHQVLVKDYAADLIRDRLIHIDFYRVVAGHTLKTHVPLQWEGNPAGVKVGGVAEHSVHELLIECLPKDLPSTIKVDISALQLGQSLHVRDLQMPAGVEALTSAEQLVIHIAVPRGVSAEGVGEEETEAE